MSTQHEQAPQWPPQDYPTEPGSFKPTLRVRTHAALRQHMETKRETIAFIAQQSGVGFSWLRQFSQGSAHSPTVENIEKLYYYLTGRAL